MWRWPRLAWLHLPAAAWAGWVVSAGWICPLTPLENALRRSAGEAGYGGSFQEHYLLALIYPEGLTRPLQVALGLGVLLLNVLLYALLSLADPGRPGLGPMIQRRAVPSSASSASRTTPLPNS